MKCSLIHKCTHSKFDVIAFLTKSCVFQFEPDITRRKHYSWYRSDAENFTSNTVNIFLSTCGDMKQWYVKKKFKKMLVLLEQQETERGTLKFVHLKFVTLLI